MYYTVINYKGTVDTVGEKLSRLCFVRGRKYNSDGMGPFKKTEIKSTCLNSNISPTGLLVRVVNVETILSDVPPNIF